MNAVAFRSEGHPYGCSIACGMLLQPGEATHSGVQERLSRKDADGLWIWSDVPDEGQIFQALRSGKPIASVDGAQMLVLHPRHEERWDKCEAEVYWGAVEALYAAEPDAPSLDELLHFLARIRKPLDKNLLNRVRADLKRMDFADDPNTVDALREVAEQFIRVGALPEQVTQMLGRVASRVPDGAGNMRAALYAARLASPRDRRAAVAALPLAGFPDLLG